MSTKERIAVMTTLCGLLMIAKIAMPDTYFQSDTRLAQSCRVNHHILPFASRHSASHFAIMLCLSPVSQSLQVLGLPPALGVSFV